MRHVAFLRGMNVGGHRLTNVELCGHVAALGFGGVTAFLASGNVVFDTGTDGDTSGPGVGERIECGLRDALGYAVPTFVRTADEVREIAARAAFDPAVVGARGKEQVLLLRTPPPPAAALTVLALATDDDPLAFHGRELHWLPRASVLDTGLDLEFVERTIGPTTTRTKKTVERLVAKFFTR